jgi:hypothetical protein
LEEGLLPAQRSLVHVGREVRRPPRAAWGWLLLLELGRRRSLEALHTRRGLLSRAAGNAGE